MKTVSLTFELYDLFFPEDKTGKDFTYMKFPMSFRQKSWGQELGPVGTALTLDIASIAGANRTASVQLTSSFWTAYRQVNSSIRTAWLKKLEQNGVISSLVFDSKQVSKQVSKEEIDSRAAALFITNRTVNKENKDRNKGVRRSASAKLPNWEDLKEGILAQVKELQGYSVEFMEERWVELLAYDEGRPYKNRKSGATNWFNSPITKEKWAKRPKTSKEEFEELRAFAATGGIIF